MTARDDLAAALAAVKGDVPCASEPDAWFSDDAETTALAVMYCLQDCPLVRLCRRAGNEADERAGVWGGWNRSIAMRGHRRKAPELQQ